MDQEKIGKFIAKLRKEKKMTQQELADKLNVTDRAIGNWENGRRMPDVVFYKPLCETFGISLNELLNGEKIKEKELKEKTDEVLDKTIKYSTNRIKRIKRIITISIFIILFLIFVYTFRIDYNRVKRNEDPIFMIMVNENKDTYTYIGFGYKMIKKTAISPFEPLDHSINIKFGFWVFAWNLKVYNTRPYNLWVINDDKRVLTEIGSYCITDSTDDKYKSSECNLSIPIEDIEYDGSLPAKSNDIIAIDRSEITIARVTLYDLDGVKKDILISYNRNDFKVPEITGEYIVLIDTISNRGTAWYSFKLNIERSE